MNSKNITLLAFFLLCSFTAQTEVTSSAANGFEINIERTVKVDKQTAYLQFIQVHQWWISDHTWFGDAKNLSIDAYAGGCFCEKLAGKEMLHMTVSMVNPDNEIRMIGGLGPLQMMGVQGGMSWQFIAIDAEHTKIVHHYQISGYYKNGLQSLAVIVDKVQSQQVDALVARLLNKQ